MNKLIALLAITLLLLLTGSCEIAQQDETTMIETDSFNGIAKIANIANIGKWRRDALAYLDEVISQSKGKSDIVSTDIGKTVIIQSPETLEKLKQYIRNSDYVSDITGLERKPSPGPFYQVGEMPWMNFQRFNYVYENPYQLISFSFTEADSDELCDYLYKLIQQ